MAVDGPRLIGVQPHADALLANDTPLDAVVPTVLNQAPRELTLRFDGSANLDLATLPGVRLTRAGQDDQFNLAYAETDFNTAGTVGLRFEAINLGQAGNLVSIVVTSADLGPTSTNLPAVTVAGRTIQLTLNTAAGRHTRAIDVVSAINNHAQARVLAKSTILFGLDTTDVAAPAINYSPIQLSGAGSASITTNLGSVSPLGLRLSATTPGAAGNNLTVQFAPTALPVGAPPTVSVSGTTISVQTNSTVGSISTAQSIVAAINGSAAAAALVRASLSYGNPTTAVGANAASSVRLGGVNDVVITPGYIGLGDTQHEVIMRFADTLPDDRYRIEVFGIDDASLGTVALRNVNSKTLNPTLTNAEREIVEFDLELGTRIVAVSPQPLVRVAGALTQREGEIVVHFGADTRFDSPTDATSFRNPAFYRLIDTATGSIRLPVAVLDGASANSVTLDFGSPIGVGTFQLRIGATDEPNNRRSGGPGLPDQAVAVGAVFDSKPFQFDSFLGDDQRPVAGAFHAQDVDLYRFEVPAGGANVSLAVQSHGGLDAAVRLFSDVGTALAIDDSQGVAGQDVIASTFLAAGVYYVGVSGSGNTLYDLDGGNAIGGTTTGAYTVTVTSDAAIPGADDNSSFGTATSLGRLGLSGQSFRSQIEAQTSILQPPLPGGNDEPGHREIPVESHIDASGTTWSAPGAIPVFTYSFPTNYQGQLASATGNAITPNQKQRAREIFEIYGSLIGTQFQEVATGGLQVVTGDTRAVAPTIPPTSLGGIAGGGMVVMNGLLNWGSSEYGGGWFNVAMHEIGHALGLEHSYDLPSIMGAGENPTGGGAGGEAIFPKPADVIHAQRIRPPNSTDIDLYKFTVEEAGTLSAETIAERLTTTTSHLNSLLRLYRETPVLDDNGVQVLDGLGNPVMRRDLVAQNDDYYSNDSRIEIELTPGTYYLGVSSTGNDHYDPIISDTGFGGTTDGIYDLKMSFTPAPKLSMQDADGVALDGDGDGVAGGVFNFWFQGNTAANTIYVDKMADVNAAPNGTGTLASPYDQINTALAAATASPTKKIVRIVGNGGTDGDLATLGDNRPYLVGLDNLNNPLVDGSEFLVPAGVTVMVDAGAMIKLRAANLDVGTPSGSVSRAGGALQILGTPESPVHLRSFRDDALGGDSDGPFAAGVQPGDWGGVVFRDDSDREAAGVFLNFVAQADIQHGGGKVFVAGIESVYTPIHLVDARPTIIHNSIANSGGAALSANPNSFDDQDGRIGPEIHGNRLTNNSLNGLFVRIQTDPQTGPIDRLTVTGRFDDTELVHVITENLEIVGNPARPLQTIPGEPTWVSGRLAIDPGTIVKLYGARIEATRGTSNLIAEGTVEAPVIFTSLLDDRYGGSGSLDTSNNADVLPAGRGNWGGLVFDPVSSGSIDHAYIAYGGGVTPIEGTSDRFNAIEITQATVRVANSILEENASGNSSTSRFGRGDTDPATIFVRGAQPVLVNNILQNNSSAAISIDANSLVAVTGADPGRSTGARKAFEQFDGNQGPLVRFNRLANNTINGMQVRGGEVLTQTVWDDTDIVHVVDSELLVMNHHTSSGIRLQSSSAESLVVKLSGAAAGFTADGTPLDIDDRLGGTIQVVGAPGHPVVLTSLADCTVGAGFTPAGAPLFDTQTPSSCTSIVTPPPTTIPYVDVIVVMDESGSMGSAQTFSAGFIQNIETALVGAGIGTTGGPNQYGLVGFGGSSFGGHELGHSHLVGGGLFGTAAQYAAATTTLTISGAVEDGYSGLDVALNYPFRPAAKKFIVLVTDEPRSIVDASQTFASISARIAAQGIVLEGILGTTLRNGSGTRALAIDGAGNAYIADGAGGFSVTTGGSVQFSFGNIVTAYVDMVLPTGGLVGDISQISAGGLVTQSFASAMISNIVTNAGGGTTTGGAAGDWRSVKLERYSNDTNVAIVNEAENANTIGGDINGTPISPQELGELAKDEKSGNDVQRLGFEVHGAISHADPTDVDVYRFIGVPGSEVWLDIDRTLNSLDTIIELVDGNGNTLVRSLDNNTLSDENLADTLVPLSIHKDPHLGGDYFSTNRNDAGLRVVLPDASAVPTVPPTPQPYYVRVRSTPAVGNLNDLRGGLTRGAYQLQIRLRETDELPGSTVRYSDIRYATNGVEVYGQPAHSPLAVEAAEARTGGTTGGDVFNAHTNAQPLGNLLTSDQNVLAVAGELSSANDIDWYRFTLDYDMVQVIGGSSDGGKSFATLFDIDYADGLARPDAILSVFDSTGRLILVGRDSDIADDQGRDGQGADFAELSRGSVGQLDPFIGTVQLPAGLAEVPASTKTYYVAVSSNAQLPRVLDATFRGGASTNGLVRMEPISSIRRIAEDHIGFSGYTTGSQVINATAPVMPTTSLFDITDSFTLSTHITPFQLSDVQLYVSTGSDTYSVNPFDGSTNYTLNQTAVGNNPTRDIAMRADGLLFGYEDLAQANTAGQIIEINTGVSGPAIGSKTARGTDAIPDVTTPAVAGQLTTDRVDAFTFRTRSNGTEFDAYYSVRDTNRSMLYLADAVVSSGYGVAGASPFGQRGPIIGFGVTTAFTTGMAFDNNGTLYGVNTFGDFYRISTASGAATLVTNIAGLRFSGLALGPQNLNNGAFSDMFFATTDQGELVAFSTAGVLQPVFDTDADGVADSAVADTGILNVTGLAFSPLDFNLWHPTARRGLDAGHGVNDAFDDTRDPTTATQTISAGSRTEDWFENQGGASFYFGLERWTQNPSKTAYYEYGAAKAQYGILTSSFQQALTQNPLIRDNYNLPGGAHGSLTTGSFSLAGYSRTDKPSLYFNYFLDTENSPTGQLNTTSPATWRDSARIFITDDNGVTWFELATNNSQLSSPTKFTDGELPTYISTSRDEFVDPRAPNQAVQELFDNTTGWRQARIDLADFEGKPNLKLRFDFSTAGNMNQAALGLPGEDFGVGFTDRLRASGNTNEGFYIDDIIIGFAERGEMVTNAPPDQTTFFSVPTTPVVPAPQQSLQGPYTLEIRRGTEYIVDKKGVIGNPYLGQLPDSLITASLDTNDRLVSGWTISTPDSALISEGDAYFINNGRGGLWFEFDSDSNLGKGGKAVAYQGLSAAEVATNLGNAINASGIGIYASVKSATANSIRVDLTNAYGVIESGLGLVGTVSDYDLHGDLNAVRRQGHVAIESNAIRDAAGVGILVDAGARDAGISLPHPGGAAAQAITNNNRLVPGVTLANNLIVGAGTAAIRLSGDPNGANTSAAVVPFSKVINNTIYGATTRTGIGVQVTENAAATLINNIFANLTTAVSIDTSSQPLAVLQANLFQNNGTIVNPASVIDPYGLTVPVGGALFVDAANDNFYLVSGSDAIDSSLNKLGDRFDLLAVKTPLGIPAADVVAPARDLFGQLRSDDTSKPSPPGLGTNIFKDRGAIDRNDIIGPFSVLVDPTDNDGENLDVDRNSTIVQITDPTRIFRQFDILLADGRGAQYPREGTRVDPTSVASDAITVMRDGVLLKNLVDYVIGYDSTSDLLRITPLSGIWRPDSSYVIGLANRDRHVLTVPSAATLTDGQTFSLRNSTGVVQNFVFRQINPATFPSTNISVDVTGQVIIPFLPTYDDHQITSLVMAAINTRTAINSLSATWRGGSTLNLDGVSTASAVSPAFGMSTFFVGAIRDLAGNSLQQNQADGQTRFTILLPTIAMDFGDVVNGVDGRMPTLFADNGARHVAYADGALYLGRFVDGETNGLAGITAVGDNVNVTATTAPTLVDLVVPASLTQLVVAANNTTAPTLQVTAVPLDGETFTIANRGALVTFEFDANGVETAGRQIIDIRGLATAAQVTTRLMQAVRRSGLSLNVVSLAADQIRLESDNDEDGATFGGLLRIPFNPQTTNTPIEVFASGAGFVDAWIDWNGNGDWSSANEQVLRGAYVAPGLNTLSVSTPTTAVIGNVAARFRFSLGGGLSPRGIEVGGEVEDYLITVVAGNPPVVANDVYTTAEDTPLWATAQPGGLLPGNMEVTNVDGIANNHGVLANDFDPDAAGIPAGDGQIAVLITPPQHAQSFTLYPNGTFDYVPLKDFNGVDSFTYRSRDNSPGALVSNAVATVTINVQPVNDVPFAYDDGTPTVEFVQFAEPTVLTSPNFTFASSGLVANDKSPNGTPADPSYSVQPGTLDDESGQLANLKVSFIGTNAAAAIPAGPISYPITVPTTQGGTVTLSGLGGTITYTPAVDFNDYFGALDSFTYFVQDDGVNFVVAADGTFPVPSPNTQLNSLLPATAYIRVKPRNDAPINSFNGQDFQLQAAPVLPTNEDTRIFFRAANNNALTVNDVDVARNELGAGILQVTLAAANGTVSLNPAFSGLVFTSGTGTDDVSMTFRGTIANINAALEGSSFLNNLNYNTAAGTAVGDPRGPATVTITVNDLGNYSETYPVPVLTDTDVVTINVVAVNDAPINNSFPMATQTVSEDSALVFSSATSNQIYVSDIDYAEPGTSNLIEVTLTAVNGTITLGGTTSVLIFSVGDGVNDPTMTFRGTLNNVNNAMNGMFYLNTIDYNSPANPLPVPPASLTITSNDLGNVGGGSLTDTDTVLINVTPVNDAPINRFNNVTFPVSPINLTVAEDNALVFNAANSNLVSVFDVDAMEPGTTGAIQVRLDAANGTVTLSTLTGLTVIGGVNGSNTITVQGTPAALNTALDGMFFRGTLNYNLPGPGNIVGPASLTITTNDLGNVGAGGPITDTDVIGITVTPVDDAPVHVLPAVLPQQVLEDSPLVFSAANGNQVRVTDLDFNEPGSTNIMRVTLTAANGTITLFTTNNITIVSGANGSNTVTFEGSTAGFGSIFNVNNAMNGMTFVGTLDYNTPAGTSPGDPRGPATLTITSDDLGNVGSTSATVGGSRVRTDVIPITVNPVNDGPINLFNGANFPLAGANQTVNEDAPLFFNNANSNRISVTDVDVNDPATTGLMQIRLDVANGTVTLGSIVGLTFIAGANGSNSVTFQGSPTNVNNAMNGMFFQGTLNFNTATSTTGPATLTITTSDLGNVGVGGPLTDVDVVTINVVEVNDGPINFYNGVTFAGVPVHTTNEDTPLVFNAANNRLVSVFDQDAASGLIEVTLAATNGTMTLSSSAGLLFSLGDGDSDPTMTFRGSQTLINQRLNGMQFKPLPNFFGTGGFTITTNDLGLTGLGGPLSDTDSVTINVTAVNDVPVNVIPAPQSVREDATLFLSASNGNQLSVNDDSGSNPIEVTLVATNGLISLSSPTPTGLTFSVGNATNQASMKFTGTVADIRAALDGMSFRPPLNYNGPASISVTTNDLGAISPTLPGTPLSVTDVLSITVVPVNDAPVNTVPGAQSTGDSVPLTFSAANLNAISIADLDAGNGIVQVQLTATNGTITLASISGLGFAIGDGTADTTMRFTGTISNINAGLSGLVFTPTPNFVGSASLSIVTNDLGLTGVGGQLTDTDTIPITVVAINHAPVITVPAAQTVAEDVALTFSTARGNSISVSDDAGTLPIQVTLNATNGAVTLSATSGLTFSAGDGLADATMTMQGTQTAINAALNGLVFQPTSNFNGAATVQIVTNDLGNGGAVCPGGCPPLTTSSTVAVTVTPVNDLPTNTIPAGSLVAVEGVPLVFSGPNAISVADVDGGLIQVTLAGGNGLVSLSGVAGLTFTNGDGTADATMTFTGTQAAINSALNGASFTAIDTGSTSAQLTIITGDPGVASGPGTVTSIIPITISLVNNAPVNSLPATPSVAEGGSLVLSTANGNAISVADDANLNPIQITLTSSNGTMQLAGVVGLTFTTGDGNPASNLVFSGTLTALNAALNGLQFTPAQDFTGTATITITTDDLGQQGSGGPQLDTDTLNIQVTPVNDAPVNTVPATQTLFEDTNLAFDSISGNSIAVVDIDAGSSPLEVTLSATVGVLNLTSVSGLTFTVGDGTSDATMTFRGTIANINAALQTLVYQPAADFNGTATLTILSNDLGATGTGGPLQDTDTVTLNVVSVNDAPVAGDDSQSTNEDVTLTIPFATLLNNDSRGAANEASETLTISAVSAASSQGGTVTIQGGAVVYQPKADFNGTDTFTYTVRDNGTTNGAADAKTATATVTVTVASVNDAPRGGNDTYFTRRNTTLIVASANGVLKNDVDPDGDPIRATSPAGVTNGTLFLNADGSFSFQPTTGFFGQASFTYRAADASLSSSTVTVVINVDSPPAAVNDQVDAIQNTPITVAILANDNDPDGQLNLGSVSIVSGSGPTLGTLVKNADGTVTYNPGNNVGTDSFRYTVADATGNVSNEAIVSINVNLAPALWQNPTENLDVNGDTFISPLDALIIINDLNIRGSRSLFTPQQPLPIPAGTSYFLDVNGDRSVAPSDVLRVINYLNLATGNAEGETNSRSTVNNAPIIASAAAIAAAPASFVAPSATGNLATVTNATTSAALSTPVASPATTALPNVLPNRSSVGALESFDDLLDTIAGDVGQQHDLETATDLALQALLGD